jgi:hypothetical protein
MGRRRSVPGALVTSHRQIPVIQQLSAVTSRPARGSTSTFAGLPTASRPLLEVHRASSRLDSQCIRVWPPLRSPPRSSRSRCGVHAQRGPQHHLRPQPGHTPPAAAPHARHQPTALMIIIRLTHRRRSATGPVCPKAPAGTARERDLLSTPEPGKPGRARMTLCGTSARHSTRLRPPHARHCWHRPRHRRPPAGGVLLSGDQRRTACCCSSVASLQRGIPRRSSRSPNRRSRWRSPLLRRRSHRSRNPTE